MYKLVTTKRFNKNLINFLEDHSELKTILNEKIKILSKNPKQPDLRTHKLSGKLQGYFGAWITYKYRIIFCFEKNNLVLEGIGDHDSVY